MPTFGRTQYFFGEVVLTYQYQAQNITLPSHIQLKNTIQTLSQNQARLNKDLESNIVEGVIDKSY